MATKAQLHPEVHIIVFKGFPIRVRYVEGSVYISVADARGLLNCRWSSRSLYETCASLMKVELFSNARFGGVFCIEPFDLVNLCKSSNKNLTEQQKERIEWLKKECENYKTECENKSIEMVTPEVIPAVTGGSANIQTFCSKLGELRVSGTPEYPLFCLTDVCKALNITNNRNVKARLDQEDVCLMDTPTKGGVQQLTYITEGGLYDVILRSDAKTVRPFRKWVTSEILPTIRKHGVYATPDTAEKILSDPDVMIKVLEALKEERAAKELAQAEILKANLTLECQSKAIDRMEPKEKYYDTVITEREYFSTSQIAGEIGLSYSCLRNRLFKAGVIEKPAGPLALSPEYKSWMELVKPKGTNQRCYQWTKEGREGIFKILAPDSPH